MKSSTRSGVVVSFLLAAVQAVTSVILSKQQSRCVSPRLFGFGVIADIQYVDDDDAHNFQGTKIRRYRQSLDVFKSAVSNWNTLDDKLSCAVVLGDMLDGKATTMNISSLCWEHLSSITQQCGVDIHYCLGNHDYYTFDRTAIHKNVAPPQLCTHRNPNNLFYDWAPHPGWRFISLDSYDISLIGASSPENQEIAKNWLAKNNPNDLCVGGTWFDNLSFDMRRWVPYNGGVGAAQLNWFDHTLSKAAKAGERVIVFCHQPVWAPSKPQSVIWNAESLQQIMSQHGNVCMWLAGHDHDGQYQRDETGIHHLVPPAPIECGIGETAFGHIDVYKDKLRLHWTGRLPSKTILPFPTDIDLPI